MAERADIGPLLDYGTFDHGGEDGHCILDAAVRNHAVWADAAACPDRRSPGDCGVREDGGAFADLDAWLDVGAFGIDDPSP